MFRETFHVVIFVVATIFSLLMMMLSVIYIMTHYQADNECEAYAQITGYETLVKGNICFVKDDNGWHILKDLKNVRCHNIF